MGKINIIICSLLYQAQLHHSMWDYTIEYTVWLKNRLPMSTLPYRAYFDATTPFQAYHKHKLDLKCLRIFGCVASVANSITPVILPVFHTLYITAVLAGEEIHTAVLRL